MTETIHVESEAESALTKEVALGAAVQGTNQVGPDAGSDLQRAYMDLGITVA